MGWGEGRRGCGICAKLCEFCKDECAVVVVMCEKRHDGGGVMFGEGEEGFAEEV